MKNLNQGPLRTFLFLLFVSPSLSAYLRFANFYSNGPNIYVFVNNQLFLSDIAFRSVTSYVPVGSEDILVSIGANEDPAVAWLSSTFSTQGNDYYTVVATRNQSTSSLFIYNDDLTEPDYSARVSRVRVLHTAAGITNLKVEIGNQTINSLYFGSASPYVDVTASTTTSLVLKVQEVPVYRGTLFLQRGVVYSLFIEPLIVVALTEDFNAYKAEIRVFHASPDAASFKFGISAVSFEKVVFSQHTEYKSISPGNYSFALNFSDGKRVQSTPYFFSALSLTTVVVHGWSNRPDSPQRIAVLDDADAPINNSCIVRFANFAPDSTSFRLGFGSTLTRSLTYGQVSGYDIIAPGTYAVTFNKEGDNSIYESTIALTSNTAYDVFIIGTLGHYQLSIESLQAEPTLAPHGSLSGGDIAGIVIGVIGGSIVVVVFMIWYSNRLNRYQNI